MKLGAIQGVNAGYVVELYERYRAEPRIGRRRDREVFETWSPADQAQQRLDPARGVDMPRHRRRREPRRMHPALRPPCGADRSARLRAARRSVALPEAHGITDEDLQQLPASLVGGFVAETSANAFEAIEKLRRIYCSTTGFDFAHVFVPEERVWLRTAAESGRFLPPMDAEHARGAARPAHGGRGLRAVPPPRLPRQDALLDRRARHARADARRDHQRRRAIRACGTRCSGWRTGDG